MFISLIVLVGGDDDDDSDDQDDEHSGEKLKCYHCWKASETILLYRSIEFSSS